MPEISESELQLLRGSRQLLDDVWHDPKHGMAIKRAVKAKHPDFPIPEIDVPDVVLRPLNEHIERLTKNYEEVTAKLAARDLADSDAKLEAKFQKQFDGAKTRFNLTDEGVAKTIEIMKERQIADPEAAAALHIASLPRAKTTGPRNSSAYGGSSFSNLYGMRDGGGDELLHNDPDAYFDREVTAVMDEFAAQA